VKKRIVYSDNGTHTDLTNTLGDYNTGVQSLSIVASEDTVFIGSYLPFNHFYLKLGDRVNDQASSMNIRLWDGKEWVDVAQVLDSTKTSTFTLGQSGYVEFIPRKEKGWSRDDTVYVNGGQKISGLGTSIIYEQFWAAMSFTANLTSNLQMAWIGNVFSNDDDLGTEYPSLDRDVVRQAIDSSKSSYEKEHVYAGELLVKDLIFKNIIVNVSQILYKEDLKFASVAKTAELIFTSLGDDYKDDRAQAKSDYAERLNNCIPKIDTNLDGRLDDTEVVPKYGRITR